MARLELVNHDNSDIIILASPTTFPGRSVITKDKTTKREILLLNTFGGRSCEHDFGELLGEWKELRESISKSRVPDERYILKRGQKRVYDEVFLFSVPTLTSDKESYESQKSLEEITRFGELWLRVRAELYPSWGLETDCPTDRNTFGESMRAKWNRSGVLVLNDILSEPIQLDLTTTLDPADQRDIVGENNGNNSCANFFRGMGVGALNAIRTYVNRAGDRAFNEIPDNSATGIRMVVSETTDVRPAMTIPTGNGEVSTGLQNPTTVTINTNGAFIKRIAQRALPRFGGYNPGTLGSRMVLLLHEMGHIVIVGVGWRPTRIDGRVVIQYSIVPLLPFDGKNDGRSSTNTDSVLTACQAQLMLILRRIHVKTVEQKCQLLMN
jgi:hypothetical protein